MMKTVCIFILCLSAFFLFSHLREEKLPELYNPPQTFEEKDFKWSRAAETENGNYFRIKGDVVALSAIKNILRIHFSDGPAFTEINFYSSSKKLNIVETKKLSAKNISLTLSNGKEISLRLTDENFLQAVGDFPEEAKMSMGFILPYEFFADTTADLDGKKTRIEARKKPENFANIKNIAFCADAKETSFGMRFRPSANAALSFGKSAAQVEISFNNGCLFEIDMGVSKTTKTPPPPQGVVHKIGNVDFWAEERMVLPDTRGKNLLQNSSFEMDFQYLAFRHFLMPALNKKLWQTKPVKISENTAKFGKKSLEIFSDAADKMLYQPITTASVALEKGDYVFSVWAKSNGENQTLKISLANPAKLYEKHLWISKTFKLSSDWKRYELPIKIDAPQISPFVFIAMSDSPAVCNIDGMQLERGKTATDYRAPCAEGMLRTFSADNFVEYGKPIDARLDIIADANAQGTVDISVEDFFGEKIFSDKRGFTADASGFASIPLDFEKFDRGVFLVKTNYRVGEREHYNIQRFVVADFLKNEHKHKNLFVDTYVDPLSTQQFFPQLLARYRALGYGARAGYMNTDSAITDEAVKYGVDSLGAFVGRVRRDKKHGRAMVFLSNTNWFSLPRMTYKKALMLDYWRNLPENDITPAYLKKVEEVAEIKSRANPNIKIWSGFGEPEGSMTYFANPDFAPREDFLKYIEIECAIARGVRKGNPDALLCTSVTSTLNRKDRINYFDRLLGETKKRGVKYDCIGAHIYRGAPEYPRPTLEENYQKLFDVLKKHGYENAGVYSPEGLHWLPLHCYDVPFIDDYSRRKNPLMGVLPYTYDIGHGERLATALRARTWLLGLKHSRIKSMNASNYGISQMDAMLTPYAYDKIPNTLGVLLGNSTFEEELNIFPDTRCYVFQDEKKRPIAALWACRKEFDRGLQKAPELSFAPVKNLRLFDLMQARKRISTDDKGAFNLPLSIFPVFLVGEENSMEEFKAMLKSAKGKSNMEILPTVKRRMESPSSNLVEIENPYAEIMRGTVAVRSDIKKFEIPVGGSVRFSFASFAKIFRDKISSVPLKIILEQQSPDKKSTGFDKSYRAFAAGEIGNIKVDGDLSEWAAVPSVKLENMRRAAKLWRNSIYPSKADFSAEYKIAWNKQSLCVAVVVKDQNVLNGHGGSPDDDSKCDGIELVFDTFGDANDAPNESGLNSDDWHYKIWKSGDDSVKVYRQFVPDVQLTLGILGAKQHTFANDVKAAFKKIDGGYIVEIEFSGSSVLPFKLEKNSSAGLCVIVNDFDDPNSPQPKARLTNSTSLSEKPELYPDKFPTLILEK